MPQNSLRRPLRLGAGIVAASLLAGVTTIASAGTGSASLEVGIDQLAGIGELQPAVRVDPAPDVAVRIPVADVPTTNPPTTVPPTTEPPTGPPTTEPATTVPPSIGATAADRMYSPTCVTHVAIATPQSSLDALALEPKGDYQPATMTLDVCSEGGQQASVELEISIRLKGTTSIRTFDGKPAIKIKIKKADRPDGLKKMTLNNMVQDRTGLNEAIAYEAFAIAGVRAPRSGYATVTVNGINYGLHANVETLDDFFLDRVFGEDTTDHLYESPSPADIAAPAGRDIVTSAADAFDVDEGDEDNINDLRALAADTVIVDDAQWWQAFQANYDEEQLFRLWAVERYIGHWDSYTYEVNNYYLFHGLDGEWNMLPSGADQTQFFFTNWFDPGTVVNGGLRVGELVRRCIGITECFDRYRAATVSVGYTLNATNIPARLLEVNSAIAPYMSADLASWDVRRTETTPAQHCASVNLSLTFFEQVQVRWAEATEQAPLVPASVPRLDCSPF